MFLFSSPVSFIYTSYTSFLARVTGLRAGFVDDAFSARAGARGTGVGIDDARGGGAGTGAGAGSGVAAGGAGGAADVVALEATKSTHASTTRSTHGGTWPSPSRSRASSQAHRRTHAQSTASASVIPKPRRSYTRAAYAHDPRCTAAAHSHQHTAANAAEGVSGALERASHKSYANALAAVIEFGFFFFCAF